MKIAYVFAGQGSQQLDMGKDLYLSNEISKKKIDEYNQYFPIKEIIYGTDLSVLNKTENAQPAIIATSLMLAHTLNENGIKPQGVCGLSLGEYSALCFSSVISEKDIITIVRERGRLMSQAFVNKEVGMVALLGGKIPEIEKIVNDYDGEGVLEIANYNAPGQVVITGEKKSFISVEQKLKECGVRKQIPLVVSGAFHSSMLKEKATEFEAYLQQFTFQEPKIEVYYNVSGLKKCTNIRANLKDQMQSSVLFQQTIENMIKDGYTHFIEIGPGTVLQSFIKKINKNVYVDSVNDQESLERVIRNMEVENV